MSLPPGDAPPDRAQLLALLRDADAALVTALDPVDAAMLAECPRLRVLANIGVGYDNIDLAAANARGIVVTNTPGATDDAVADLAIGLMIGAARRLPLADTFVRGGRWTPATAAEFGLGLEVGKRALGIVGLGHIGQAIARRARGFDMTVIYHSRRRVDAAVETALGAAHAGLDDLLQRSDYVVLTVPYSAATRHLIGAAQLAKMKPTAILVNVARGGVVDDAALVEALRNRTIAGAALDCFENEPAVNPGLLELSNVIFTPHVGGATASARQAMVMIAVRNLLAALQGEEPPNRVGGESTSG